MANVIDRIRVRAGGSTWGPAERGAPAIGYRRDPFLNFAFSVTIDQLGQDFNLPSNPDPNRVGFSKISGIGSSIVTEDVVQGSDPRTLVVPKGIEYDTAVFEKGFAHEPSAYALWQWFDDCKALISGEPNKNVAHRYGSLEFGTEIPLFIKKRDIHIEVPAYPQSFAVNSFKPNRRPFVGSTWKIKGMPPRNAFAGGFGIGRGPGVDVLLHRAWPISLKLETLDANGSEVWIARMEMRYEGLVIKGVPS